MSLISTRKKIGLMLLKKKEKNEKRNVMYEVFTYSRTC